MDAQEILTATVDPAAAGQRIDAWLHARFPQHSRSRWQVLLRAQHVSVDGNLVKPSHTLHGGETVRAVVPPPVDSELAAEDIPLRILYEDADLLFIDKPPGLVVHPAPGHQGGTLVNALLHHCEELRGIGGERRPGIVHRLDCDTSGVMVVAKCEAAMTALAHQFKEHLLTKEYAALVWGIPEPPADTIATLIARNPRDRKKMAVSTDEGRHAVTHYRIVETFRDAARLDVVIDTGRTHQIRVHLSHRHHPVIGDRVYGRGGGRRIPAPRQMLHARRLALTHPLSGEPLDIEAPIPYDFVSAIAQLRHTD